MVCTVEVFLLAYCEERVGKFLYYIRCLYKFQWQ